MAASSWIVFYNGKKNIMNGTLDLDSDTIKCALLANTWTPSISNNALWSDISAHEIAAANGYTAGGNLLTSKSVTLSASYSVFKSANLLWPAVGGPITARYAVVYNSDNGALICYCLLDTTPADVTAADGTALLIQLSANGYFYLD